MEIGNGWVPNFVKFSRKMRGIGTTACVWSFRNAVISWELQVIARFLEVVSRDPNVLDDSGSAKLMSMYTRTMLIVYLQWVGEFLQENKWRFLTLSSFYGTSTYYAVKVNK